MSPDSSKSSAILKSASLVTRPQPRCHAAWKKLLPHRQLCTILGDSSRYRISGLCFIQSHSEVQVTMATSGVFFLRHHSFCLKTMRDQRDRKSSRHEKRSSTNYIYNLIQLFCVLRWPY